jgi:hypothetical protein
MKEEHLMHLGGSAAAVFFSWISFHVTLCASVLPSLALSLQQVQFLSAYVSITVGTLTLLRMAAHVIGRVIDWFKNRRQPMDRHH